MVLRTPAVRSIGRAALNGLVAAVIILLLATLLNRPQQDLANRVDRNAEISKDGVAALICILEVDPITRTREYVDSCLAANGFDYEVQIPENAPYNPEG